MGLDKFYTKTKSKMCIDLVDKEFKLETFDLIVEPSTGNGSFQNKLSIKISQVQIYHQKTTK